MKGRFPSIQPVPALKGLPTRSPHFIIQRPALSSPSGRTGTGLGCRVQATDEKDTTERVTVPDRSAIETPTASGGSLSGLVARLPAADEISLFLVAAFWGTNPVCLRYIYQLEVPPSPASLAAIQASGAAIFLTLASLPTLLQAPTKTPPQASQGTPSDQTAEGSHGEAGWPALASLLKVDSVEKAGAELGCWTFLANAATITAFQHTPASRGAFLIRLTAVFTPAVASILGQEVVKREWIACGAALLGGILISLDTALSSDSAAADAALGLGDALMVVSACLWSIQTVRLGRHAKEYEQLTVARNQTAVLALLSVLWLAQIFATATPGTSPTGSLFSGRTPSLVWAAVLWPAAGPWGLATILQVRAQRTVSPSRTQVIMATDPLWATAFAGLLAGEPGLGSLGWLGAACILSGSIISRH